MRYIALTIALWMPLTALAESSEKSWEAKCSTNEMTDKYSCTVTYTHHFTKDDELTYIIISAAEDAVFVRQKDLYPHRDVQIRIDKHKYHESKHYIEGTVIFPHNKKIIEEMKTGESMKIRYDEWPRGLPNTLDVTLKGFAKAYNEAYVKGE